MSITSRSFRVLVALVLLTGLGLASCSGSTPEVDEVHVRGLEGFAHVPAPSDEEEALLELSERLFESATVVVLTTDLEDPAAVETARAANVPLLPDTEAGRAEAERLGARTVSAGETIEPVEENREPRADAGLVVFPEEPAPAVTQLLELAGARSLVVETDPRTDDKAIEAIAGSDDVLVFGGDRYEFEVVHANARAVGDSFLVFPGRHVIALYGHPETAALGVLGAQGPKESVKLVKKYVKQYEKVAPGTEFVPSFEIIATVASASAEKRNDYSRRTPVKTLKPLVDAAEEAGVLVILDLQPGRASMLEQAKHYEEILKRPHVGLALDPEWNLGPNEKHLVRIGHVTAKEVNEVSEWLAELTRENVLPQKLFVLHQFTPYMIEKRKKVVTDHPELATLIHVDGQGAPGSKHGTWNNIRQDPPKNVFWGWKNFLKEDEPMLTVAQTWEQVKPLPELVTYQ